MSYATFFILCSVLVTTCNGKIDYVPSINRSIRFQPERPETYVDYVNEITDFLKKNGLYENLKGEEWGICVPSKSYGYPIGQPCLFMYYVNNQYSVDAYDFRTLPPGAPENLRSYIRDQERNARNRFAYVTCEEIKNHGNVGPVNIYKNYQIQIGPQGLENKLVAAHFEEPKRFTELFVACGLWADFEDDYWNWLLFSLQIDD